jgi:PIN domain nuclease of toxin-antitoxin system
MRVLLDTHVVLWWLSDDPALGDDIKGLLDAEPDAYVSAATLWEISIKQALGKLGPLTWRSACATRASGSCR